MSFPCYRASTFSRIEEMVHYLVTLHFTLDRCSFTDAIHGAGVSSGVQLLQGAAQEEFHEEQRGAGSKAN